MKRSSNVALHFYLNTRLFLFLWLISHSVTVFSHSSLMLIVVKVFGTQVVIGCTDHLIRCPVDLLTWSHVGRGTMTSCWQGDRVGTRLGVMVVWSKKRGRHPLPTLINTYGDRSCCCWVGFLSSYVQYAPHYADYTSVTLSYFRRQPQYGTQQELHGLRYRIHWQRSNNKEQYRSCYSEMNRLLRQ